MTRYARPLAACALLAAVPLLAQDPVAPPADELVQGREDRHDRMTVPVTIEGQGPFQFLIDTGAQATVVTRGLRDRLKLRAIGRATVVGMAARKQVELVRVDGLEFAARVFDAIEAPLLEAQHVGADGILGLDSLQDLRVLIDFRAGTIAVNDADSLGGDKGYEIVVRARNKLGRLIITDATVDGVKTAVIIDTGAQGSMGNRALEQRLRTRPRGEITTTDVTGGVLVASAATARTIVIDRMRLSGVPMAYADAPAFAALGLADKPAMVLGIGDLRAFHRVAIDFAERTVLFDLPPGASRGTRL